jgi:hypothetical protein
MKRFGPCFLPGDPAGADAGPPLLRHSLTQPSSQAAGKAEGRQEADEARRPVEMPQEAFLSVLKVGQSTDDDD